MTTAVRHDAETGFHLVIRDQTYRPITATRFDDGEEVRVASATPCSSGPTVYIVVRSADGQIVEDWRAV